MSDKPWRAPRVDAKGNPVKDPGGPCPHCPPGDPVRAKKNLELIDWAKKLNATAEDLMKLMAIIAESTPACLHCKGTGHVRVCGDCDGDGVMYKIAVESGCIEIYDGEETYEVEPAVLAPGSLSVLRKAVMGTRKVKKTRPATRKTWANGPICPTCSGVGIVSITKDQVSA